MNDILVGIDFSDCSINALEHALTIAKKAEKKIMMVWVNCPESKKELLPFNSENIIDEVNSRFEKLVLKYQPILKQRINYEIREGKIYQEIVKSAEENNVLLIVVGTHGASGFEEFWIGSNANKIISATYIPVITIRGNVDVDRELKKIVLPIDSTPETRQKIIFTVLIAGYFNAEIHVLALYSGNSLSIRERVDKYAKQVIEYLNEESIRYHYFSQKTDHITNSTIEYAKKIDANLISIMTEQEYTASNILLGSYASQMVNNSPVPVLNIHPKIINEAL